MATHHILKDGTSYAISGGTDLANGTKYQIGGGRTLIDGTVYEIGFGPKQITITVPKDVEDCRVTYNGAVTTAGNITINVGDSVIVHCSSTSKATSTIYLNGVLVKSGRSIDYEYTPSGNAIIEFTETYSSKGWARSAHITEG